MIVSQRNKNYVNVNCINESNEYCYLFFVEIAMMGRAVRNKLLVLDV